jgi:hypothetical protein
LWTNVLPPKWSVAAGVTDAYVSRATFEKMRQVAEASPADASFVLTRGSPSTGGAGKTFRTGREIEFRWLAAAGSSTATQPFWEPLDGFQRKDVTLLGGKRLAVPDPAQLGVRWRYVSGYDSAATASAIRALVDAGATRVMFNDLAVLQELGAVSITTGVRSVMTLLRDDLRPAAGGDAVVNAAF